jgi:phage/plasmid-associated DNA primase
MDAEGAAVGVPSPAGRQADRQTRPVPPLLPLHPLRAPAGGGPGGGGGGGGGPGGGNALDMLDGLVSRIVRIRDSAAARPEQLIPAIFSEYGTALTAVAVGADIQADIKRCCTMAAALNSTTDADEVAEKHASVLWAMSFLYYMNQCVATCTEASSILKNGPASMRMAIASQAVVKPRKGRKSAKDGDGDGDADVNQIKNTLVAGIAKFATVDVNEANKLQQLYIYMLTVVEKCGYRRMGGRLYARKLIDVQAPDGSWQKCDTHAWDVRYENARDFVMESTRKETNYDMWLSMTASRYNLEAASEYLMTCRDPEMVDLEKDRTVFAFENGIYLARSDTFIEYGTPEHATLSKDVTACKYFAVRVDVGVATDPELRERPEEISTPALQSVLDFQAMCSDTSFWLYAMLGRLLYEVGDMDNWQVIPFLQGAAATGKSTICNMCHSLYEACDVGTLSNNIERKFGLSALVDKLMFVAPEIKSDIQLEQAEFQSIVSGETVQVATKFQLARSVRWTVPGIMCGNQVPGWVDNSGSINRRIVLFEFPNTVKNGDMNLSKKIQADIALIIIKANRCYRSAVEQHGSRNIWNVLPQSLLQARSDLSESVNSIVSFLQSGVLEFGPDLYMPIKQFSIAYVEYVNNMALKRQPLNQSNLVHTLMGHKCRYDKKSMRQYPRGTGSITEDRFVVGCDFSSAGGHGDGGGGGGGGGGGDDPYVEF